VLSTGTVIMVSSHQEGVNNRQARTLIYFRFASLHSGRFSIEAPSRTKVLCIQDCQETRKKPCHTTLGRRAPVREVFATAFEMVPVRLSRKEVGNNTFPLLPCSFKRARSN
jgi:hypothetical protein